VNIRCIITGHDWRRRVVTVGYDHMNQCARCGRSFWWVESFEATEEIR
jgi:hypothetical protein